MRTLWEQDAQTSRVMNQLLALMPLQQDPDVMPWRNAAQLRTRQLIGRLAQYLFDSLQLQYLPMLTDGLRRLRGHYLRLRETLIAAMLESKASEPLEIFVWSAPGLGEALDLYEERHDGFLERLG